jgi:hypothetical protein
LLHVVYVLLSLVSLSIYISVARLDLFWGSLAVPLRVPIISKYKKEVLPRCQLSFRFLRFEAIDDRLPVQFVRDWGHDVMLR